MRISAATIPATVILTALCLGLLPSPSAAQQPLAEFLQSAKERSLDVREAGTAIAQAQAQASEARARLLPSLMGQASYQRNYPVISVSVPTGMQDVMGMPITRQAVITPGNQYGAIATLTVPLVDLSAWSAYSSAKASAKAAETSQEVVQQSVSIAVTQLWYALVAQRAMVEAALRNLQATQVSRDSVARLVEVGIAGQLELARSEAELARAKQSLADAQLQATLTARNLANLTGLEASDAAVQLDTSAGDAAPPIAKEEQAVDHLPAVRAALAQAEAADAANSGAWKALLPSIAANTAARWNNAAGFGKKYTYYAGVTATWLLDFVKPARIANTDAAIAGAKVRAMRAEQEAQTAIFEAQQRVETSRTNVDAMIVAKEASQRAVLDAKARFESGTATQLDLIQAQRDAFQAEVAVIQAAANLQVAREVLDIRRGLSQ